MSRIAAFALAICISATVPRPTVGATGAPCPIHTIPPYKAEWPKPNWGKSKTDSGIKVDGFITLDSSNSQRILHGVDLSESNPAIDYARLSECGATFGFVRLATSKRADKLVGAHIRGLQSAKMAAIPYSPLQPPHTDPQSFRDLDDARRTDLTLEFEHAGEAAADIALDELEKLGTADLPTVSLAGLSRRIVALDVEIKLKPEPNIFRDSAPFKEYGALYARAVCTWVERLHHAMPNVIVFLYTSPSVYQDYLSHASDRDNNLCLRVLPIWLARTTPNGRDLYETNRKRLARMSEAELNRELAVDRTCNGTGRNRCIVHQYTHRGVFAAKGPQVMPGQPDHIDLDRFFRIETFTRKVDGVTLYFRAD